MRSVLFLDPLTVQQIDDVLIPVEKIAAGMFPSEAVIWLRSMNGTTLTLFADRHLLEDREERQYLRVTRMEVDSSAGYSVCVLPVDAESGTRWIRVRNEELRVA